jgi:transposase
MARPQTHLPAAHLEARRLRAISMVSRGASQAEVARRLGVTREAVRQWVAAWNSGGRAALAPRPRGKQGRVALARVSHVIDRVLAMSSAQLTTRRVRQIIQRSFGIAYSASSIRAILHRLGFEHSRALGWHRAEARRPQRQDAKLGVA